MADLRCPHCGTELMKHEAGHCLNMWVQVEVMEPGSFYPPIFCRRYSERIDAAWDLMQKVWELDPAAEIHKDFIDVDAPGYSADFNSRQIDGPTFAVRVSRAALWLAARQKEHPK